MSGSRLVRVALGALCYAVVARLGLALDAVGGLATLVWPPTGLAFAMLVVFGREDWPAVALGAFAANLWVGAPLPVAAGIAVGNTLEAVIGATLVARAGGFRRSLDELRSVAGLVLFAALASTLVSASGGTLAMVLGHVVPPSRAAQIWEAWWVGDMMGELVVAPLLLTLTAPDDTGPAGSRAEALLLAALFAATLGLVFGRSEHGFVAAFREPHLLMPLLIWASVRFGPRGAAAATFFASAGAVAGTTLGRGSFVRGSLHESLLALQSFMGVVAVTFLLFAAVTAERRRLLVRERARHFSPSRRTSSARRSRRSSSSCKPCCAARRPLTRHSGADSSAPSGKVPAWRGTSRRCSTLLASRLASSTWISSLATAASSRAKCSSSCARKPSARGRASRWIRRARRTAAGTGTVSARRFRTCSPTRSSSEPAGQLVSL